MTSNESRNKQQPAGDRNNNLTLYHPSFLTLVILFVAAGQVAAEPCDISFHLDKAGQVSLAVYDDQGRMLRELARGIKMDAGEHHLPWDGLDRYGQAAPAGGYEWRLLETPGFTREFLVNVGTNPGWTPFDLWPGNHSGPTSLMVDADTNVYVAAFSSEGPPHLLKMTADGKRKLWDTGRWGLRDGLIGLARLGNMLYLLFRNGVLKIISAETGTPFWNDPKLSKFPFADLVHPNEPDADKKPEERKQVFSMNLAGGKDFLVVTYQKHDEIRFLWPKDGIFFRTNSVHVPEPKGCCVTPDGRVFVVSGKSIIRVNPETGEVLPVVTDPDLVSPTRIAYDTVKDDLLVVEHGENLDNIRRYHAADGKLIASYGRRAGRTYGVFNPLDWAGLTDIAADGQGGFFTVEEFPRRVAHFSGRERHQLVAQWFGGMQWGALCALDPADPTIVYLFPDYQHCARGCIDYAARTWTLTHLYDLPQGFSWVLGKTQHREMFPNFGGLSYWQVRHVAGQTFLVNNGRRQGGCAVVVRVDEQNNRLVPVAILGGLHPTLDREDPPAWWLAAMKQTGYDPKAAGYTHFAFSWSDTNCNGKIDVGEIKIGSVGNTYTEAHCFIDPQWNVYQALNPPAAQTSFKTRSPNAKAVKFPVWLVVPNESGTDLPVWNWDHAQRAVAVYPETELNSDATAPTGIFRDSRGNTYTTVNGAVDWKAADLPPIAWPNNTTGISRFQKWRADGALEWSVGLHTAEKDRPPGQFAQVRGILGEVHDCLVVVDPCEPASVWTHDGLFAGSFLGQRVNDGLPDIAYANLFYDDNHWGLAMQTPQGDVLWGSMSDNSTPIYRIRGWDNWERQNGRLLVTEPTATARKKGAGLHAEYFANSELAGTPALTRLDPDLWFGPMWGDYRSVPTHRAWFNGKEPSAPDPGACSARWTGFFEPPLTENYSFVIYTYGQAHGKNIVGSKVRLWVDGQLIIDEWDNVKFQNVSSWARTRGCSSSPIRLAAGHPVPIRLEYAAAGGAEAHLHLFYGSFSLDLRHVPQNLLYPGRLNPSRE